MEVAIFLLVICSLLPLAVIEPNAAKSLSAVYRLVIPAALFVALVGFQLMPLPPSAEALLSPSTFNLYRNSLPGWAGEALDRQPLPAMHPFQTPALLPTSLEIARGASIPFLRAAKQGAVPLIGRRIGANRAEGVTDQAKADINSRWRPLSVDASLTRVALLKLIAYLSLFLLITSYPLSSESEPVFIRRLLNAALVAGVMAASIALLARALPNGKTLWLFTPYDWKNGNPWGLRATGPFANPDHFADYLDLVLPFALTAVFMPGAFIRRHLSAGRAFFAAAVIVIASALLLSSSRGGWLGALTGFAVVAGLWPKNQRSHRMPHFAGMAAWGGLGLFLLVLLLLGPGGRTQTDLRLQQTVGQDSVSSRLQPAKNTLKMIRDFPIFGVGLGCWPEIFPHYAAPPWSPTFWNATHNDYIQLGAETGLFGFGLAACFFASILARVWRAMRRIKRERVVLAGACVAALSAVAVHEFFDFSLQTPANALLFTLLLALAVRLGNQNFTEPEYSRRHYRRLACGIGMLSGAGLIAASIVQEKIPYPYNLTVPATLKEAYSLENAHPANARVHLMLVRTLGDDAPLSNEIKELRAAVWLEPTNPFARDLYAQTLFQLGYEREAFNQVSQSVLYSPALDNHLYLQPRRVPWLSPDDRTAIEAGFRAAVGHGYEGALQNFAGYYDSLFNFSAEARLYAEAAGKERDSELRAAYFLNAGTAYAKAEKFQKARVSFEAGIAAAPKDSNGYEHIIMQLWAPQGNLAAAEATVAQGIERGADPFKLYLALSWAAQKTGNNADAETALEKALAMQPSSLETLVRMGELDLAINRFDRAADYLRKALKVNPSSVVALSDLATAEEGAYEYFAADQAYQRALAIAPTDAALSARYAAFRQKLVQGKFNEVKP